MGRRREPIGKWRQLFESWLFRPKRDYTFGPPASAEQLKAVESALSVKLPTEIRSLLSEFNGVWRQWNLPGKEIVYFSTDGMLTDVAEYLRKGSDPPVTPSGIDLRKVVFVAQMNGFADLYGVCTEALGEFRAGRVVKLDHESGELEPAWISFKKFVEHGPK